MNFNKMKKEMEKRKEKSVYSLRIMKEKLRI